MISRLERPSVVRRAVERNRDRLLRAAYPTAGMTMDPRPDAEVLKQERSMRRGPVLILVMLVAAVATAAIASCGGMPGGMQRMHAPQPERVEGSLSEMPVGDFYRANCAVCHGDRRQGAIGPPLLPATLVAGDDFYYDVIANGRPGTAMPAWAELGLEAGDIRALVAFLRTEP